ncbi:hypothetical protein KC220_25230, partial [Mycobacterium tuberculosis]|nr:hypothetical protein [Mycobacterium tuberculosis]
MPFNNITNNAVPLFYFRIFLDYQFRSIVHPQLLSQEQLLELELDQIVEQEIIKRVGRKGQQKYRKEVIN